MITIQRDEIRNAGTTRYQAIADALARRIADGEMHAGDRLPTHRDLAWQVGVTVGTVTRAYAELERRGLIVGEVGRGTFVRGRAVEDVLQTTPPDADETIDFTHNFPPRGDESLDLPAVLRDLADDPGSAALLGYQPHAGRPEHRAAGAEWIGRSGWTPSPENVLVTAGAQHGILIALAALTRPGDRVAAEALTHPGLMAVAHMLGLGIDPIAIDGDGLIPEAVEAACRNGIKAIYTIPTLQNPTTSVLPPGRREAIAEIARRHDVAIVEDDLFAFFRPDAPPPLCALAPDHGIYVTSLSKTVAPGLRLGFVAAPPRFLDGARMGLRASCWMAPPIAADIAARWIGDGTAARILASHRREAAARLAIGFEAMAGFDITSNEGALHLWLALPERWRLGDIVGAARRRGIGIASDAPFRVARADAASAIRVCLGPPVDRARLRLGLDRLAVLLREEPEPATSIV